MIDPVMITSEQLRAVGDEMELHAGTRELIGHGEKVAALVDFQGPAGNIWSAPSGSR